MFTAVQGSRVPIRMWADPRQVEDAAMHQLRNIADLPWVHGVAVMPDVHLGKGATVGSVIAMRDAVSPSAVGVDIGCGMSAVRTSLRAADLPDDLSGLRSRIESAVPVGFGMHTHPVDVRRVPGTGDWDRFWSGFGELHEGVQNRRERALAQMGSLGGGNHFIEVCLEQGGTDDGRVWLMLHSGSRNIGKELAERHIEIARGLAHNADLPDRDLAVFVAGTPQMRHYRRDLFWAQEYARRNRAVMVSLVQRALADTVAGTRFDEPISCHHNYVAEETYDGVELLVTRKGAIRAGSGELGIIPGSMGTGSFIVRGLGNTEAFTSASHGAGRRMSRTRARKSFTARDLAEQTAGVECRKDAGVVDEIPAAYKDINEVIKAQTDLVEVVAHLKQVVCVKG
ncbi:RtcB family protein [Saccharopolyspora erythraea]|uniref:RtcB family protein n=1 Tax=Saccharopolyspora erythraea TaxID=1836 RepID=UPI001BADC26B|nr:RtcB family protein [Saccharopolyspora erythraea]QUH02949.1 RtcB family protein [Saccharopolyspora erythraea]